MNFLLALLPFWFSLTLAQEIHPEFASILERVTATLYKKLASSAPNNFVFSPFSLTDIMALVQSGAYGTTGEEIRAAFNLGNDRFQVDQSFSHIKEHLLHQQQYSLRSANKIYVHNYFPVNALFKENAEAVYYSEVENINLVETEAAANSINQWVEEKTENKIKDFISAEDITWDTLALLVNALHFRGNWSMKFDRTDQQPFYLDHSIGVKFVDTMHGVVSVHHYTKPGILTEFVELSFEGDEVTLTVAIPFLGSTLSTIEDDYTLKKVFQPSYFPREETYANLTLPKFKLETKIDFVEALEEMGIRKLFNKGADLSGIAGDPGQLYVGKVQQKSFIDVNEIGVEAAAATAAGRIMDPSF